MNYTYLLIAIDSIFLVALVVIGSLTMIKTYDNSKKLKDLTNLANSSGITPNGQTFAQLVPSNLGFVIDKFNEVMPGVLPAINESLVSWLNSRTMKSRQNQLNNE